ncbi:MAG: hypothetical protein IKO05_08415 [Selenomonadaceae bacterium]|nr:hypothetical protein [Selenomonadaceae bacterium]
MNYVWQNGDPFSKSTSTAGAYVSFSEYRETTNSKGITYRAVRLNAVEGISFTKSITTGNGFVVDSTNVGMQATAGVNVSMNSGHVTGGKFGLGTGRFRIGTLGADLTDATVIKTEGFADGAVSFVADDENLQSVTTSGDLEGIVTVTGDYDFSYNGAQVKITGAADDQSYQIYYDDDGRLALDLSTVTAAEDDIPIRVVSAGGAEAIVPPMGETELRIGTTTYEYANTNGNAEFLVSGTDVTGFVLSDIGDSVTISKDALSIYDAEDTTEAIATVSGSDYTVTKLRNGYQATINKTSTITIGETTLDFTISKATRDSAGFADGVTILFNEGGEITGVAGLSDFTGSKDTLTVKGAPVTDEEGGLPVFGSDGTLGHISVSTGDFTYTAGNKIKVADGVKIFSVDGSAQIYVGTNGGKVTDNWGGTYNFDGKGYLRGKDDEIVGFVFELEGTSIVLPVSDAIPVYYNGKVVTIPAVNDSDGAFKVTLTKAGKFLLSDLGAGATVKDLTFKEAGGSVTFDPDGDIESVKYPSLPVYFSMTLTDSNKSVVKAGAGFGRVDASARTKEIKITGNALDNFILGGSNKNSIYGGAGNDTLRGGDGNDKLVGGTGNDSLLGENGDDKLLGESGADSLFGGKGNDYLNGGDNDDKLFGGMGNDKLVGENGADVLSGGSGDDSLYGGADNDSLLGEAGKDYLRGGKGNDYLDGGKGNDSLLGEAGDDILGGGKGNDTLTGGAGADTFLYAFGDGKDVIVDFSAEDTIKLIDGSWSDVTASVNKKDVTLKIGSGSIKIKNAKDTTITIVDGDGRVGDLDSLMRELPSASAALPFDDADTANKFLNGVAFAQPSSKK